MRVGSAHAQRFRGLILPWGRPLGLVLGMNVAFLVLSLLAAAMPAETLRARALQAFATGSLSMVDYRPFDLEIGWHQYNDCLIVQMVANQGDLWSKAIGPVVYHRDDFDEFCGTTRDLLAGQISAHTLQSFPYTRYWHGHNAMTGLMLPMMPLSGLRSALVAVVYASVGTLAVLGWCRSRELRVLVLCMASVAALFWALPYFGQGLSHGAGDACVMLGFVALLLVQEGRLTTGLHRMICAGFGAVLVFMEFLTGLLPTAAAFLVPFCYFLASSRDSEATEATRWRLVATGVTAFAFGALLTVAVKQSLAYLAFGSQAVDYFMGSLQHYGGRPVSAGPGWGAAHTLATLIRRSGSILTYGNSNGATLLFSTTLVAWAVAALLALRKPAASRLGGLGGRFPAKVPADFLS